MICAITAGVFLAVSTTTAVSAAEPGHPDGTYSLDSTSGHLRGFVEGEDGESGYADTRDAPFLITQTSISDDHTPSAEISRSIDLGNGLAPQPWTGTGPKRIIYSSAGTYTPNVSLTDGDGNTTIVPLPTITVKSDEKAPVLRITRPARVHKVAAWRRIRGGAYDTGIGLADRGVTVRVWEKRNGTWYGYNFTTKRWVKGKRTFAATRSMPFNSYITTSSKVAENRWHTPYIQGLKRGYLHVEAIVNDRIPLRTETRTSADLRRW